MKLNWDNELHRLYITKNLCLPSNCNCEKIYLSHSWKLIGNSVICGICDFKYSAIIDLWPELYNWSEVGTCNEEILRQTLK